MSGAVHTPGPWVLGRTIGGHIDIDAPHAPVKWTALARVVVETEAVNGYSRDPEAEANAHLIAAAPELLEALEEAAALIGAPDSFKGLRDTDTVRIHPEVAIGQVKRFRAAIAKARGAA